MTAVEGYSASAVEPGGYYRLSDLRRRGWTRAQVRKLLGEPDLVRPNPHRWAWSSSRLFAVERVHSVEQSDEWKGRP